MEYFVKVVMEKQEGVSKLDESIFAESQTFVTEQDCTIFQIPLQENCQKTKQMNTLRN